MLSRIEEKGVAREDVDVGHRFGHGLELGFGERAGVDAPACGVSGCGTHKGTCGQKSQLLFHVDKLLLKKVVFFLTDSAAVPLGGARSRE